ncbi:MAG: ComEA family DNA-binding protein [Nitrospinota bacterium]
MKPPSVATALLIGGLFIAAASSPAVASQHEKAQLASRLDINKATQQDIARHLNPVLGKDVCHVITLDRAEKGPYKSLEDLTRIEKITKDDVEKLRETVCVDC